VPRAISGLQHGAYQSSHSDAEVVQCVLRDVSHIAATASQIHYRLKQRTEVYEQVLTADGAIAYIRDMQAYAERIASSRQKGAESNYANSGQGRELVTWRGHAHAATMRSTSVTGLEARVLLIARAQPQ